MSQEQLLHTNVLSRLINSRLANVHAEYPPLIILQLLSFNIVPGQVTSLQVGPSITIINGLTITWGPPSGSNYPTPVTYQLRYRERPSSGSPGGWSSTVWMTATEGQYTTPVLKPDTRYEVQVWAFVSSRSGPVSAIFNITGGCAA